jgi:hypothetical protein
MAWTAGAVLTAAQLNTYAPQAWSTYVPVWTAATANPALGDGAITGSYVRAGETVHFSIRLTLGSTTTTGTGAWRFSLPVSAAGATTTPLISAGQLVDTGTAFWPVYCARLVTFDTVDVACPTTSGDTRLTVVGPATPFTWVSSDILYISGTYEAA